VLGQYPTGVCVVTARHPDGSWAGFVVGSFTSVSLDPPLVAFFPDKGSTSWPKIQASGRFCVNILSADQEAICRRFASRAEDKFQGIAFREARSGAPILNGVAAWIDCDLESVQEAGDHYIVLGRVQNLDVESPGLPLLFFQGGYGRFSPLSLTAVNRRGTLTQQLRDVDLVRAEMERLADELSARCIATALVEGEMVVIASAGSPHTDSRATLVGQRLPFAPPMGAPFAAWMDASETHDWLQLVRDEHARDEQRQRLATIRRRGYSVGLFNEARRAFAFSLDRLAADPQSLGHDDMGGLISQLEYDPVELSPRFTRDVRVIMVPVFDRNEQIAFILTVYGFRKPDARDGVDSYIKRVRISAQRATELIGGETPRRARETLTVDGGLTAIGGIDA
jgi:flavin reductase (DIM6/NTAB) family NADH-FMN oxidoreductase RutF/DNA-binding IclR family transcriptional regulator